MERNAVDKIVLVTGATSGIGRAVALRFAESGARVVAAGRNGEALREVGDAIKSAGGQPLTIAADVTKEEDVRNLMQRAIGEFERLDVLVNANLGSKDDDVQPGRDHERSESSCAV